MAVVTLHPAYPTSAGPPVFTFQDCPEDEWRGVPQALSPVPQHRLHSECLKHQFKQE